MLLSRFSPTHHRPGRRHVDGSTLPATMMVVAVMLALLSAAAYLTSQDSRFASRQASKSDLLTAADAALEYAYSEWKTGTSAIITGPTTTSIPSVTTWDPSGDGKSMATNFNKAYANSGAFAANTGVTVNVLGITAVDQNGAQATDSKGTAVTTPTGLPNNNVPGYPGWAGKSYNYAVTANVTGPSHYGVAAGDNNVTVKRYFQVTSVPLFQAAIFYENDLEIHPGAKMVITGPVHTNSNFYGRGIGAQVQFMSNVSVVGKYSEGSNPAVTKGWDGTNTNGANTPENIDALYNYYYNTGTFPDLWADGKASGSSQTQGSQVSQGVGTIDPFGGAKQDSNGLHDIVDKPDPGVAYSQQIAYDNASLHIDIDSSQKPPTYTITDSTGTTKLTGADLTNVQSAMSAPKTITDFRENATVTVTDLDMAKLAYATVPADTLNKTGEFLPVVPAANVPSSGSSFQTNFNGLVYIRDVAATTGGTRTAIRLINGRSLGQNVTVASNNGVYIQGDYNTGGTPVAYNSGLPSLVPVPSNVTGGASPNVTGYNRHSSAVMADAVTILSNSWSDGNSGANVTSRLATATTVNTAILAGDVPSNVDGEGYASGGAHNFPRFLEDWGPENGHDYINFTYTGSLVEAFKSEKFTGHWQTNNVYRWPNRLWSFDTNFATKQPPGVPQGIQFSRGRYERTVN